MSIARYQRLSRVYDMDWGDFSLQYVDLIRYVLDRLGIDKARVLDLGCGTGVLAVELGKAGHIVHGIDISPHMIQVAGSKSSEMHNVSFELGDMTGFELNRKFDVAACAFDSINYLLDLDEVRDMFECTHRALDTSGVFVFDSNTRRLYRKYNGMKHAYHLGDERFIQEVSYNSRKEQALTTFEFMDGEVEKHRQRPYDLKELRPLLKETGFRVMNLYRNFKRKRYNRRTERLICVAQKQGRNEGE
ncbi:MAG: class I SAM-dependent DNA methyltransferase [Spirochaetota bacterium]